MDTNGYNQAMPPLQALNAIATYDGRKDPDAWLNSIQAIAGLYNWTDDLCLKVARVRLTGPAWNWAYSRQFSSWSAFEQQLQSHYGESKETAIARLECCRQHPYETVQEFADRYLHNADKAGRVEDAGLVYNFSQRLQPDLKLEVARQHLHSIEDIVTFCNFWTGLLQGAGENMDPISTMEPAPLFDHCDPCQAPDCKFRDKGLNGRANRPPPLRDNTNFGHPTAPRADYRPPFEPSNFSPAPTAAPTDAAVNALASNFKRLEVQFLHQLQEQDQEILALRTALKEERQQHPTCGQFNTMVPLHDAAMGEPEPSDDENDLDFELLGTLMAETDRHIPLQRQPYNAASYPIANNTSVATAATYEARATHSSSYMVHDAAPPQVRSQPPTPAQVPNLVVAPVNTKGLYTCQPAPSQPKSLPKGITCSIMAVVNGKEVDCMLDTGTATSTITLDCLRKLGLDSLINPSPFSYLNADGCATVGKGKVHNIVLSLGDFVTRINPTVTAALHYNMLIGHDVLHRARAVIDYNRGKMVIQVDPTLSQEIDIALTTPDDCRDYTTEAINPQEKSPSQPNPSDEAYMVSEVSSAQPCFSCPAFIGQPSTDTDTFTNMWNASLDKDDDIGSAGSSAPSTPAAASAAAVNAAPQATLHQANSHMEGTAAAGMLINSSNSPELASAETPETLHAVDNIRGTALSQSTMSGNTYPGPRTARAKLFARCMEKGPNSHLPHLLTLEPACTSINLPEPSFAKPAIAAKPCVAAMDPSYSAPSLKYTLGFGSGLQQDSAEIHHEVLTIFDPGGCHLHAPWRAVCCSPTPVI